MTQIGRKGVKYLSGKLKYRLSIKYSIYAVLSCTVFPGKNHTFHKLPWTQWYIVVVKLVVVCARGELKWDGCVSL